MVKTILFLARYPFKEHIQEGMFQRVSAIDQIFSNISESKIVYLYINLKTFRSTKRIINANTIVYDISFWTSPFWIMYLLLNSDLIYCHSLYGLTPAYLLFFPFIHMRKFILDIHGIIPEELILARCSKLKILLYSTIERISFFFANKIIVVSNNMKEFYLSKYPNSSCDYLIYPILPSTIPAEIELVESTDRNINIVYAGNVQGYQNVPKMISSIKMLLQLKENLRFYILTGALEEMLVQFKNQNLLPNSKLIIKSVRPEDLRDYYNIAHYGYVLRDNINVNKVACPTKIVEYLAFGLTPIILSKEIGDFDKLGCEFIFVDDMIELPLVSKKSRTNRDVYLKLVNTCSVDQFIEFVVT